MSTEKSKLEKLAKRARKGDTEAFGQIYDRYYGPVFAYIFRQVGTRMDAEDITAGVFLSALRNIGSFKWKGLGLEAWLFRIARNNVIDYYRRMGRAKETGLNEEISEMRSDSNVEDAAEMAWEQRELLSAIGYLPEEQRQVLLLKLAANLSNNQIGAVMSKSESAVKSLQHRALLNLRKNLKFKKMVGT